MVVLEAEVLEVVAVVASEVAALQEDGDDSNRKNSACHSDRREESCLCANLIKISHPKNRVRNDN